MDRDDIIGLLESWGYWACQHDGRPRGWNSRCGSAEGRYLAEAGDVFLEQRPRPATISDDTALKIDRAVACSGEPHRSLLVQVYVKQVPALVACINAGVGGDPRLQLDAAIRAVADRLAVVQDRRRQSDRAMAGVNLRRAA